MKKFPHGLPFTNSSKFVLVFILSLFAYVGLNAQLYSAKNLSGANEVPPNASPGTGNAYVTITGNFMRVQASFSGLIGTTTASHIHAPTAVAGAGTAGVATTTPTFTGFPLGVFSGTYDQTFDMTLASSFNASFLNNNGGTPASAFAALKSALDNGTAYFNLHTSAFPGGEIRAFFTACPSITVSVPDAYALPEGVSANTVYPAYVPASSITIEASASGGTAPYTYLWSDGSTTADITVSPVSATTYTVAVKDNNGCPGSGSKTIQVVDVASGKNGDKITICHLGKKSLSIGMDDVDDHLSHGDMLGACAGAPLISINSRVPGNISTGADKSAVYPNPTSGEVTLQLTGAVAGNARLQVLDGKGKQMNQQSLKLTDGQQKLRLQIGNQPNGLYLLQVSYANGKSEIFRVMLQR